MSQQTAGTLTHLYKSRSTRTDSRGYTHEGCLPHCRWHTFPPLFSSFSSPTLYFSTIATTAATVCRRKSELQWEHQERQNGGESAPQTRRSPRYRVRWRGDTDYGGVERRQSGFKTAPGGDLKCGGVRLCRLRSILRM